MSMKHYHPTEDKHLLSAMQEGDKDAFNTLFRRYYPMLCAYCHRFVDLEDAEEIVQDIMLWLWENRNIQIINTSLSTYCNVSRAFVGTKHWGMDTKIRQ